MELTLEHKFNGQPLDNHGDDFADLVPPFDVSGDSSDIPAAASQGVNSDVAVPVNFRDDAAGYVLNFSVPFDPADTGVAAPKPLHMVGRLAPQVTVA